MFKPSIFSVLLVGSLLVAPIVTANNFNTNSKLAKADSVLSLSSLTSSSHSSVFTSSLNSQIFSSLENISSPTSKSSSLITSSNYKLSVPVNTRQKVITDVKPVRLNAQSANWWKETDLFSGGNSADQGNNAINLQIQAKLQNLCPNIYDSVTKTINETNLANCAPINSLPIQKIAVIDSGVTANAEMMPFMDQASSWNFFTSTNYPVICTATSPLRFYTLVQNSTTTYYCKEKGTQSDTDYHGTVVAYTAIQTFKNNLLKNRIKIVPYSLRTLDTINISESIDEVVREGDIKTINFALGTPFNLSYVEDSVNLANTAGVNIYASSGNCAVYSPSSCDYNGNTIQDLPQEADNAPDYPAAYPNAVMVGSTNYSDNNIAGIIRATYSNFVTAVRSNFVVAPVGNSGIILPCFLNCQGATNYSYLGTSFASPQASALDGLVSSYSKLMKQNLNQLNEKVLVSTDSAKLYVTTNTTDILSAGNDLQSGTGLINLNKINDKIATQLQTLNVPVSSSSQVISSSILSSSPLSSSVAIPSSSVASSSGLAISSSSLVVSSSVISSTVAKNTMINSITLNSDNSSYIVTSTSNFTPAFGNDHIHFYYNTEANTITNKMFGTSGPYTILVSTKPAGATQLCTIVGTPSHGIYPNTGNCVNLPIIPSVSSSSLAQSSPILSSSSNVLSSSAIVSSSSTSSSLPVATPASSSQIASSSQSNSSSVAQSSSSTISSSSQSLIAISSSLASSSQSSSLVSTSSSSSNSSQSSSIASSGGGVITIITNLVSNVINAITAVNANTSGNFNANTSLSSTSLNTQSATQTQSQTIQKTNNSEANNQLKNVEDSTFVGLVNNPNGFNKPNEFAIKEKSQKIQVEIQNDFAIKEQGVKTGSDSKNSSARSLVISDEACKKGWDGTVKGGNVCDQVCDSKIGSITGGAVAGKVVEKATSGLKDTLKTQVKIANPISQTGCMNLSPITQQSDISSSNDLSKYIPILVLAIVGVAGAAVVSSFVIKQKAWMTSNYSSSQASELSKNANNKHPDLMKVSQETSIDSLKTKPTEPANKKQYVGHVTLNK